MNNSIIQIKSLLIKIEPYLFYIILLISLIPIINPVIFHTLDGAAHLHNARLIIELIKGNSFIKQFYQFNGLLVPNLTGHYILAFLLMAFKATIALKILLAAYYFLFCFSFRNMIIALKGEILISYFIFPIGFSFFLLLGFFNFMIGFIFFFYGISQLFREDMNLNKFKFWVILFILTTLIWFSHPILFLAWLIILAVFLFQNILLQFDKNYPFKIPYKLIIGLFITTLPALLLSINYLNVYHSNDVRIYTPFNDKLIWIINFRTLLLFNIPMERIYTIPISIGIFILLIINYIKLFFKNKLKDNKLRLVAILWGIACLVILFLYIILPNEMGNGGYITDRLNYLFFIFLLITLINTCQETKFLFIVIIFVLIMHFNHLQYLNTPIKTVSNQAAMILKATDLVEENQTIVAINRSPEWFDGHIENYIGINKAIYIQENYEANKGYFPIVFNMEQFPELNVGLLTPYNSCIPLPKSNIKRTLSSDYVLIIDTLNNENECDKSIYENLQQYYKLISDKSCIDFSLYKLKNNN